ncbi:MAG: DUF669 domain-containing protein [Planctomycetota bacterium]
MANLNGFDANQVQPATDFEPLPPGKYVAVLMESDLKATKSKNGRYLELSFQILEGEYQGRKLWSRLNLENPSQEAVRIARSELSSLCRAVGVLSPKDSVELHDIPLVLTVRQKVGTDGEVRNEVKGYSKREAAAAAANPQAQKATPPWRRSA